MYCFMLIVIVMFINMISIISSSSGSSRPRRNTASFCHTNTSGGIVAVGDHHCKYYDHC